MICILDPLTCGFTKVLVYEIFTSDFGVQQDVNKKVWQGNMNKKRFEKFQERYQTIAKMTVAVTKQKSQKSSKTSTFWGKKIQLPKNQFYLYFL